VALDDLRKRIDELDDAILRALDERARVVADVGHAKREANLPTYDPDRERLILDRLAARAGRFPPEAIRAVYREVMSACLALQEPLKIAYMGPEGTFSHAAARSFFGLAATYTETTTIEGVFDAVARREAQHGVVPIENSSEGTVNHTLDMFLSSALKICGEVELRIHHHLMGKMSDMDAIKRVCAHAQALAQCRGWLDEHLPEPERIPVSSNAEGARRARDERGTAAIASRAAAEIYGLTILAEEIEDHSDNTTRFLVVGRKLFTPSGADRTTLLVSASGTDDPGALFRLLEPFAEHGINMTRIESRPSRKRKWDYVFFMDVEGHVSDPPLAKALASLEARASLFKVLGSYPRAVL
jgi:chorismate mutase/prephenate dehydratase